MARSAQEYQIDCGNRQLRNELLHGCQAEIAVHFYFYEVIGKANKSVHRGKAQKHQVENMSAAGCGPSGDNTDQGGQNENYAAHCGCAGFGPVPCGTDLPNGLSGLQSPQQGNEQKPKNDAQSGRTGKADSILHG